METKDFGDVKTVFVEIKVDTNSSILIKGFVDANGSIWFMAFNAANQLGYGNAIAAVAKYCKHAVCMKEASGKVAEGTVVIPEKDMYNLMLHADDAACEAFREGVCEELCNRHSGLCDIVYI